MGKKNNYISDETEISSDKKRSIHLIAKLINWVTPIFIIVVTIMFFWQRYELKHYGVRTKALILDYYYTTKGKVDIKYKYIANGKVYELSESSFDILGCAETKWCIGDSVDIIYSSRNPKNVRIIP